MQLSSWRDRRSGVGHLMGRDGSPSINPTPGGRMVDQIVPPPPPSPGHHPFSDKDEKKASWEVLNLRWRTHSSGKDQFCNGFKIGNPHVSMY